MQPSLLEFIRSFKLQATTDNHSSVLPPRVLGLNRGAMKMRSEQELISKSGQNLI
jgi:hypothetical protein